MDQSQPGAGNRPPQPDDGNEAGAPRQEPDAAGAQRDAGAPFSLPEPSTSPLAEPSQPSFLHSEPPRWGQPVAAPREPAIPEPDGGADGGAASAAEEHAEARPEPGASPHEPSNAGWQAAPGAGQDPYGYRDEPGGFEDARETRAFGDPVFSAPSGQGSGLPSQPGFAAADGSGGFGDQPGPGAAPEEPAKGRRTRLIVLSAILAVVLAGGVAGGYFWLTGQQGEEESADAPAAEAPADEGEAESAPEQQDEAAPGEEPPERGDDPAEQGDQADPEGGSCTDLCATMSENTGGAVTARDGTEWEIDAEEPWVTHGSQLPGAQDAASATFTSDKGVIMFTATEFEDEQEAEAAADTIMKPLGDPEYETTVFDDGRGTRTDFEEGSTAHIIWYYDNVVYQVSGPADGQATFEFYLGLDV